jgi:succinate dehydrogenase / fumarate reductase membrane anchor subunit
MSKSVTSAKSASTRFAENRLRSRNAAKAATSEAWHMRVTSIALVPLTIAFVWIVVSLIGKDYAAARHELGQPLPAILMLLFLLAGIVHMKIGMESIIEDYVHATHWKEGALIGNLFFSILIGIACVYAVLKLSFT